MAKKKKTYFHENTDILNEVELLNSERINAKKVVDIKKKSFIDEIKNVDPTYITTIQKLPKGYWLKKNLFFVTIIILLIFIIFYTMIHVFIK